MNHLTFGVELLALLGLTGRPVTRLTLECDATKPPRITWEEHAPRCFGMSRGSKVLRQASFFETGDLAAVTPSADLAFPSTAAPDVASRSTHRDRTCIWKYEIGTITGPHDVRMPEGARILTAQLQHNRIIVWALGKPAIAKVPRRILVVGTGADTSAQAGQYIATVQQSHLVWHLFDQGERP